MLKLENDCNTLTFRKHEMDGFFDVVVGRLTSVRGKWNGSVYLLITPTPAHHLSLSPPHFTSWKAISRSSFNSFSVARIFPFEKSSIGRPFTISNSPFPLQTQGKL